MKDVNERFYRGARTAARKPSSSNQPLGASSYRSARRRRPNGGSHPDLPVSAERGHAGGRRASLSAPPALVSSSASNPQCFGAIKDDLVASGDPAPGGVRRDPRDAAHAVRKPLIGRDEDAHPLELGVDQVEQAPRPRLTLCAPRRGSVPSSTNTPGGGDSAATSCRNSARRSPPRSHSQATCRPTN